VQDAHRPSQLAQDFLIAGILRLQPLVGLDQLLRAELHGAIGQTPVRVVLSIGFFDRGEQRACLM
jgi:hypothetical protein